MRDEAYAEATQRSLYYLLISLYLALLSIFIVFASVQHTTWQNKIVTYLPEMLESMQQTFGSLTPEPITPTAGVSIVEANIPEAKHGGFTKLEAQVQQLFHLYAGSDFILHQHHLSFSIPIEPSMTESEASHFYKTFKQFLQHAFSVMDHHYNAHLEIILEAPALTASGPMRIHKALRPLLKMQDSLAGRVHLATQIGTHTRLIVHMSHAG
jgi:hypothetical protein